MLRIKPMVPRAWSLIAIGYNYNAQKVLYFIVTDNTGITQAGPNYLCKYHDQFHYVSIFPVTHFRVMYHFFRYGNEVGSHNKLSQYYMSLEKLWVTQCCWI